MTRVYRLRMLGLALGALPVASVLYQVHAGLWLWAVLLLNAFVWPHVAYLQSMRSAKPIQTEYVNLAVDAALGGMWVALMQFNLLPSTLLIAMLAMDRNSAGGWRLMSKSLALLIAVCLATWWLNGFRLQPTTTMLNVIACVPMLAIYPVWLSLVNYALAQRVRQQNRQLDQLNRTDVLTGLCNRSHWLEAADNEWSRYQRNQRPAALIMLDIDGFKLINDRYGHAAGDQLLSDLARLLQRGLREMDTPGRLGGDEFGIVLPETDLERASAVAERIRLLAENSQPQHSGQRIPWTVSLGVAAVDEGIQDVRAWMHQADLALYRAKSQGRNRVSVASGRGGPAKRPTPV
ncbi:diguanylate cyclase [Dyella subtropica]|uniref:diguanylate cyclase n=1 Tax=Dyella subtropica TaxID=2992127 RepID=UPI002256DD4B|nr:diguanylate cyclase [Dyella subtropica]